MKNTVKIGLENEKIIIVICQIDHLNLKQNIYNRALNEILNLYDLANLCMVFMATAENSFGNKHNHRNV